MSDAATVSVVSTFFDSLYSQSRISKTWTFDESCRFLMANPIPCLEKSAAPMVNFAEYVGGHGVKAKDVARVHALQLDIDSGGAQSVADALRALRSDGLGFLWHTTWSHDPTQGAWKVRIYVPFSEPVTGDQYKKIFQRARRHYTPKSDSSVCDPSRRFYRNSYHPLRIATYTHGVVPGSALDPNLVRGAAFESYEVPEGSREVSRDVFKKLAKRWQNARSATSVDLGDRLQKVVLGEVYASPGARNQATFELIRAIVQTYADISTSKVRALFDQSLARMAIAAPDGAISGDVVEGMVERARNAIAKTRATGLGSDRRIEDIKQSFGGLRDYGYTLDEITEIANTLGVTAAQMDRAWILQADRAYYLVSHGPTIVEACHESLINTCRVVLAPTPCETYSPTETGLRLRTIPELLERYSTPLREVRKSMVAQTPKLDLIAGSLTIPVCPLRKIEPRFDAKVAKYLEIFAGEKVDPLKRWIHFVPKLGSPLTMLVLIGAKSAGKSLLARGLARLFWTGPETKLSDVLGNFNASVERCPIVFADEHLPKDNRGREPIAALRELIQSTTRYSNQKHKAQVPIDGALRLIVAANGNQVLRIDDELSGDDAPAFAERLFDIEVGGDSSRYLNSIGGRPFIEREWIENDVLARHFMHLVKETAPEWQGRFGIVQDSRELANRLIVRGGSRAKVCEFAVKYFAARLDLVGDQIRVYRDHNGVRPFVHIEWVALNWDRVMRGTFPLSTYQIYTALEGLSLQRLDLDHNGARWFELDLSKIRTWARETGYAFSI